MNPIMKRIIAFLALIPLALPSSAQNDSVLIRKIYDLALRDGKAHAWLADLTTRAPSRLSGSEGSREAIAWAESLFINLDVKTKKQACQVPHWVRGYEKGMIIAPGQEPIEVPICALGGSIATPREGLTAEVVEVKDFSLIDVLGEKGALKDKIVFLNEPMDPTEINTFHAYGKAVEQRWSGAMKTAPYGAVGVVVRSMTLALDDRPHTGSMGYADTIPKIPACAISTMGAEKLSMMRKHNPKLRFRFTLTCETLPDEPSFNVIGEIKGSEFPDEIVTVGGHLDAWDLGVGAHDDGSGCVQAAEVLRIFKALDIRPRRTLRAVMFMNEENGGRGGEQYAREAKANGEKHIAAIESDAGGLVPRGLSFKGDSMLVENLLRWNGLFAPYLADHWFRGYGGADINHLGTELCPELDCLVLIGISPDSQRYFDYHHSLNDTLDKVNPRELGLGAALMASMAYLLTEYGIGY